MSPDKLLNDYINRIHLGDSVQILQDIPDECIALTITSPPYYDSDLYILDDDELEFGWRTYEDYLDHLHSVLEQLFRVSIPGGKVALVLSNSPQTSSGEKVTHYWPIVHDVVSFAIKLGFQMFDEVIWSKKSQSYPYIKNRNVPETTIRVRHDVITILRKPGPFRETTKKEFHSSVWHLPDKGPISEYNQIYPSFPNELVRRCVKSWSLPHDIVLDPFAGSGQVIRIALSLDRFGIGIEVDEQWKDLWEDIEP